MKPSVKKLRSYLFVIAGVLALTVGTAFAVPTKILSSTAQLVFGTVADGQALVRSGNRIVGSSAQGNAQTQATVTYASSVAIDFNPLLAQTKKITLTGVLTLTTSNLAAGRRVDVHLICDSTERALTLPGGWTALGATPLVCPVSKIVRLSLLSTTAADSGVVYTVAESAVAESAAVTYASSVAIDFARTTSPTKTITLTGVLTLTTSNLVAGRKVDVLLICDSVDRALTLPAWKALAFDGVPLVCPASKYLKLSLLSTSTTDAAVYYSVEEAARAEMDAPAYAASVAIDFARSSAPLTKVGTLTGNIELTTTGLVAGRTERVLLTADGSTRDIALPGGWTCLGTAPSDLAANKSAVFTIVSTTTADSGVFYTYNVQP